LGLPHLEDQESTLARRAGVTSQTIGPVSVAGIRVDTQHRIDLAVLSRAYTGELKDKGV